MPATQQQTTLDQLLAQMQASAEESRLANIKRQQQVEAIFDEIIARYGPGGTYGAAAEALLEKRKVGDVGMGAQRLISSGLYGTEVGGGLERAWEAEVGAPARLQLEDIKMQRLSEAQIGKAGFLENIEQPYPDYGLIMQYLAQAGAGGGGGGGVYGGYGGGGTAADWKGALSPDIFGKATPSPDSGIAIGPGAPEVIPGGVYGISGEQITAPTGVGAFGPGATMYGYGPRMTSGGWYDPENGSWSLAQNAKGTRIWFPAGSIGPGAGETPEQIRKRLGYSGYGATGGW
jgi:hypothetical protein